MQTNIYLPEKCVIKDKIPLTENINLFKVCKVTGENFNFAPGQFFMVTAFGVGEVPISISSSPSKQNVIELCIRNSGRVTNAISRLKKGNFIGIRGAYGNGFNIDELKKNNLLFIAGGLGIVPLRSLILYAIQNKAYFKDIKLIYGAKEPSHFLFLDFFKSLARNNKISISLIVDKNGGGIYREGFLPEAIEDFKLKKTDDVAAVICGPPKAYSKILGILTAKGIDKNKIYLSFERRMECGVGKCSHCAIGYKNSCVDGPVFKYWDAVGLQGALE